MVADVGAIQRMPRIVDPGRVAEIVYTGKDFTAAEAAEMGLVSRVSTDREELLADAYELAAAIAANSPLAVQGAKAALRADEGRTIEEGLDCMAPWSAAFLHSDNAIEAVRAYHEKRPPEFSGD